RVCLGEREPPRLEPLFARPDAPRREARPDRRAPPHPGRIQPERPLMRTTLLDILACPACKVGAPLTLDAREQADGHVITGPRRRDPRRASLHPRRRGLLQELRFPVAALEEPPD